MSEPTYRQIAERLRRDIESGALAQGSKLPTELELRDTHRASRNTVRKAIALLLSEKRVESRQGQGIFVVPDLRPFVITLSGDRPTDSAQGGGEGEAALRELTERGQAFSASAPQVERRPASASVARHLEIAEGEQVISRHQKLSIDGQPWALQTSYYPAKLTVGADRLIEAGDIEEGTVRYLEKTLALKQVGYQDQMLFGRPDENAVSFFKLPEDSRLSVVVLLRTAFAETAGGLVPFRLTKTVYPLDRTQFVHSAGLVPEKLAEAAEL